MKVNKYIFIKDSFGNGSAWLMFYFYKFFGKVFFNPPFSLNFFQLRKTLGSPWFPLSSRRYCFSSTEAQLGQVNEALGGEFMVAMPLSLWLPITPRRQSFRESITICSISLFSTVWALCTEARDKVLPTARLQQFLDNDELQQEPWALLKTPSEENVRTLMSGYVSAHDDIFLLQSSIS